MVVSGAPTFAALCCVYDDPHWLRQTIESVYHNVARIFFLIGDKPWNGQPSDNFETREIIGRYPDTEGKFRVVPGNWATETDQRNAGLDLIGEEGFTYCFILDADELYDPVRLDRMQRAAASRAEVGCWYMSWFTYWKSHRYRIDPPESYTPAVFVRVGLARFSGSRHVASALHGVIPPQIGMCHHMSYARTNEEMVKKITTFSHAAEIRPDWYQSVWLGWDGNPQMENLHPIYPEQYKRAIVQPEAGLPPVLRALV